MFSGQSPGHQWQRNAGGETRTIEEAIAIATRFGVNIPAVVDFLSMNGGNSAAISPPEGRKLPSLPAHLFHGRISFMI